jgi:hypothetical protein
MPKRTPDDAPPEAQEASTPVIDRRLIERHIKPLIGSAKVSAFIHSDVEQFMHDVAAGKSRARRTVKKRALRASAAAAGLQAAPSVCQSNGPCLWGKNLCSPSQTSSALPCICFPDREIRDRPRPGESASTGRCLIGAGCTCRCVCSRFYQRCKKRRL